MGLYRDIWVIGGYGRVYRDIGVYGALQGYIGNRRLWGGYGEAMGRLWGGYGEAMGGYGRLCGVWRLWVGYGWAMGGLFS